MHTADVLSKALKVFGVVLLLLVVFVECYFLQPDKPGAWLVLANQAELKMEISAFLAIPGLISVAVIFLGFRLEREARALRTRTQDLETKRTAKDEVPDQPADRNLRSNP